MYRMAVAVMLKQLQLQVNQLLPRSVRFTAAQLPRPLAPGHDLLGSGEKAVPHVEEVRLVRLQLDYKLHKLEMGPDTLVALTEREAALYYRQLVAIRRLEASAAQMYKDRLVRGFCHLYTGQEACAVGLCAALRPQDNLIAGYRIHGWAYLMGVTAAGVLAELTGRASGCAQGKGGSMHMYAPNFYGGNGIVGAQVSLGTGIALANKYRKNGAVCFALYGDGAANQGQIFECYNMSQLWKLPIVFVCENNNYGMGTSAWRASSNTNYYTRGDYLPGIWVDGQDVLAVRSATRFAIEHAQQRGPLVLELCTYRYAGHSMSDPGTSYRTREEVQQVRQRQDAIDRFRKICVEMSLLTQTQLLGIECDVRNEMEVAMKAARSDAELPLSHLCNDIYASSHAQLQLRGVVGHNLEHARSRTDTCHE
ncbi:pyruvate dehydrogenase E1 component subunit alpha, mitochondrial-like [Drosophila montana]|uniref:pyruvate dehydrogenase E1 component subunit alpha, mitochondrial-like n=1 Tax=Drosophila montana TaxID=40370 RepID=UPI00313E0C96